MNPSEKTLADFQTRVRQMIFQFQELKKENGRLQALVEEQATEIEELKARVTQADNDYNSLKMARMLEITDGNLDEAKERLSRMIRQVNKCIAILNDNEKLHIRLHVYDEEIEVTVNRADEEFYRRAAKLITNRYNAYSQAYKGKKGEHTIALMTLIDIALMLERERGKNDTAPYDGILAKLTSEIEEALK